MQDLMMELQQKLSLLDAALKEYGARGKAYAMAEYGYRVALAEKIAAERINGTPVTIISDLCRGDKAVAKARLDRDCAEVIYKSANEAIQTYKLNIKVLEAQIDREWHSG